MDQTVSTVRPTSKKTFSGPASGKVKIDRSWRARVRRGYSFAVASLRIIKQEPGMVTIAVIMVVVNTLIMTVATLALFFSIPLFLGTPVVVMMSLWVATMLVLTIVSIPASAMITYRTMQHLRGGHVGNLKSFLVVMKRIVPLTIWGLLSISVGMVITFLEMIFSFLQILSVIFGLAYGVTWSVATFFMVPVILFEGLKPTKAIGRSARIARDHWGTGLVGVGFLSTVLVPVYFLVIVVSILFSAIHLKILAELLWFLAVFATVIMVALVNPVFTTVLYFYAATGQVPAGFKVEDLHGAFRRRRGRLARSKT